MVSDNLKLIPTIFSKEKKVLFDKNPKKMAQWLPPGHIYLFKPN